MIPATKHERPVDLVQMVEGIQTHPDFVAFCRALLKNLNEKPDEWANHDLAGYLEALGAWAEDMNGFNQSTGGAVPLQPSWKMLGQMLLAAKVYE